MVGESRLRARSRFGKPPLVFIVAWRINKGHHAILLLSITTISRGSLDNAEASNSLISLLHVRLQSLSGDSGLRVEAAIVSRPPGSRSCPTFACGARTFLTTGRLSGLDFVSQ